MPGDVKGITIEFRGDTTKLSKAINQMRNEAKSLDKELGYVDKALKFNPSSVVLWGQKQQILTEKISQTTTRLNELKKAQSQLDQDGVDNTSAEYRELEREIVKCEASLRNYNKELAKISSANLENINKELDEVNKSLNFKSTSVEMWEQKQKLLSDAIENSETRLKSLKELQKRLDSGEVDKNSADYRELQREILQCESNLKSYKKELSSIPTAKLKALSEGFKKVGSKMADAGKTMTQKVTAPLVGVGAIASKIGIDFDMEMSKVGAISGATGDDFDTLREKAREMGRETKFSAEEAAEGFEYMAMAGWKPDQMLEGIEPILKLATAAGEELGTTSDIVTDALTAFGLKAKDAGHFADVLAAASTNANTNVSMLGESFKYAAPVAGALGFSVEDVTTALGLMANSGIKASQGGTALRTLFTNMANPTETMANAMETLGVSLDDGEGHMKSFAEIMQDLRNGFSDIKMDQGEFTKQMNQLDEAFANGEITEKKYNKGVEELMRNAYGAEGALKAQAAAQLAGKTGMSGLLAIVNSSEEDYNKLTEAINNCEGATDEMAGTMMDNAGGALIEMKSALSDAAIAIADVLAPWIRKAAEFITELSNKFSALSPTVQKIIVAIGAGVAVIGPLLVVIGTVISSVGTIIGLLGKLTPILTGIKAVIATIGGPWAIVIGVVLALGIALIKNWDLVKKKAGELKNWVVGKWRAMKNGVVNFVTQLKTGVIELWNGLKEGVKAIALKMTVGTLKKFFELKTKASTTIQNLKTSLIEKWNAIRSAISERVTAIKSAVSEKFNSIKTTISEKIQSAKDSVRDKFESMKETVKGKIEALKESVRSKFESIKEKITSPIETAKNTIKGIIETIKGFFNFTVPTPKIPLPHFSVTPKGWKLSDLLEGEMPSLGIKWYKNGGIFTKPTVLSGLGEAGDEAVLPLKKLWDEMDKRFSGGNFTINVYPSEGMDERKLAEEVRRQLVNEVKRNKLAWGR